MDKSKSPVRRAKRQSKVVEENFWDCSVCTYRNTAEAFKCLMCDVRKGTSTRKPRLNSALAAQQAATQAFPGASGGAQVVSNVKSPGNTKALRSKSKRSKHPARLKNIDRSSGQTREVTVNSVTVVITEYKPKPSVSRHDSSESFSESNDSRS
ncbi:YY1-associated factor 2 isoform X2 [Anopheles arabiensis]|uniref:AGAP010288-PA n=4 Tax=gambiae species complex TaxID=44542 RepID=Q7Q0K6_ANOGA|nr:YY1-associated factor 2 isoform X2 [Anopheles arabiensis]XP_040237273.1 YY1-associated factor 2 isoform X2 [Anopheles coluzzii]XP_319485.2 YY1-associated factor 2 isoform X2 [Anopheles gambiae]EAA14605.2 AGAP010288-PA [Anopheles gambiae str. PEST]